MLSEKATSERMKKRGLHHPLTRDSILLRVNAIQKARCVDEVSINMECNARLRDSWGPQTSQDPLWHTHDVKHRRAKTCVPALKRAAANAIKGRDVSTAPDATRRRHSCLFPDTRKRPSGFTEGPRTPECVLTRLPTYPERCIKTGTSLPRISPVGPLREHRLLTGSQLQDCRAKKDLMQNCEQKLSKRDKKQEKTSRVHQ